MPTTTELTEKYLTNHPSILDCLKNGIINYSKLSRKIAKELKLEKKTNIEAIQIACRRYETKIKNEKILEDKIIKILKNSEIEIKNKIIVTILDKQKYYGTKTKIENQIKKTTDTFYSIEGSKVFTIITSEKNLPNLKNSFEDSIIKISKNLAIITIKSPKELENTPGVNAFVYSKFRENGINIVEQMSCWTDTIMVIDEKDIAEVMSFLRF